MEFFSRARRQSIKGEIVDLIVRAGKNRLGLRCRSINADIFRRNLTKREPVAFINGDSVEEEVHERECRRQHLRQLAVIQSRDRVGKAEMFLFTDEADQ
jgi:hypothetical protein